MTEKLRTYRLWPTFHPTPLEVSDPKSLLRHLLNVGIVGLVLCLPPVTRAMGIRPFTVLAIIAVHLLWWISVLYLIYPATRIRPARFHIALAGTIIINTAIVVAFPALGDDPRTPLWMIPVMYACFNGGIQELEPSVGVLLIHVLMPLFAIPVLIASGANFGWSIAAPLLCSAVSATGYNYLSRSSAIARHQRRENEAMLSALRADLEQDERARLARDLHDSLGSSLAIVGLYGDLIERHVDRPDELRAIATMVREAAHDGTVELSALMGAIMPVSADLDGVAAAIAENGRRAAVTSSATIDVRVVRGGDTQLDGPVRLALVRVFQESMHNALRHGAAKQIDVQVAAHENVVSIEIWDDGLGFVPSHVTGGRGLVGMRARASELGGTFTVTASPGTGARILVTLPAMRQPTA